MRMKRFLIGLFMLVSLRPALAEHNSLLPRPQEVRYGQGTLDLRGLSIQFASAPSAEDRFAAEQLSSRLVAITQTQMPVKNGKTSGKTVLLNRTGEAGALPLDTEATGPDARESYTLQVTSRGV